MTGEPGERITSLEDELHAIRSEQQALLSLNAIRRHHTNTLRAALLETRALIEGIANNWGLTDPAAIVRRSRSEAEAIVAVVLDALAIEDPQVPREPR